ncbi:hypothetical protein BGW41_007798 [Actinomortierella wolfii]|nr:hypothetical protein BGW41_007798 [Actinomortierella wolfii]
MARAYPRHNGGLRNTILPIDLMIHVFEHLRLDPADLLHCALTTSLWSKAALQELYRHPWMYLFTYQFEAEGRVMDKMASLFLLRTLFSSCLDPPRTLFPYASFARSINLKWVNDTFDLPEAEAQILAGLRWTRSEPPKEFIVRSLIACRPYIWDFVHSQTWAPRCQPHHHSHHHHHNHQHQQQVNEQGQQALPLHILQPLPTITSAGLPLPAAPPVAQPPLFVWDSTSAQWVEQTLPGTEPSVDTQESSQEVVISDQLVAPVDDTLSSSDDNGDEASTSHSSAVSFSLSPGISASRPASQTSPPISSLWPLSLSQTQTLTFLDLRFTTVTDQLLLSLAAVCRWIESFKIANHWQHYQNTYSITDRALSYLVAAQDGLKLVHVENHREISHDHELVETLRALAVHQGSTLETLVLKTHDFQNCDLGQLGTACRRLKKFAAPGGMHLMRDQVMKLTEACKLTLEHLDFSSSDIETSTLMAIVKGLAGVNVSSGSTNSTNGENNQQCSQQNGVAPTGSKLKALILMGMEDTLNQETCAAIGEYATGLDCFRLDILESEARDVALMLSMNCGRNLRVLTLGCHDVSGDLANDILEKIAINCRLLEILDVNHWTFSNSALEKVLRKCRLLRYLNVSYTSIDEQAVEVICECLGEIKMPPDPTSSQHAPTVIFEEDGEEVVSPEGQELATNKGKGKDRTVADDIAQLDRVQQGQQSQSSAAMARDAQTERDLLDEYEYNWLQWCSLSGMIRDDEANVSTYDSSSSSSQQGDSAIVDCVEEDELDFHMEMDESIKMDASVSLDIHRYRPNDLQLSKKCDKNDASSMLGEDETISDTGESDDADDDNDGINSTAAMYNGVYPVDIQHDAKGKGISIDSSGGLHHPYPGYPSSADGSVTFSSASFPCVSPTSSSTIGSSSSASSSASSSSSSPATLCTTAKSSTLLSVGNVADTDTMCGDNGSCVLDSDHHTDNRHMITLPAGEMSIMNASGTQATLSPPPLPIPSSQPTLSKQLLTNSLEDNGVKSISGCAVDEAREVSFDPSITSSSGTCSSLEGDADEHDEKDGASEKSGGADDPLRGPFYSRLEHVNIECCSNVSIASENKIKDLMAMKQEAFRDPTRSFWAKTWVSTSPVMASSPSATSSSASSGSSSPSTLVASEDSGPLVPETLSNDTTLTTSSGASDQNYLNSHLSPSSTDTDYTATTTVTSTTGFLMQNKKTTRIWAENEHDMMMTRLAMERDGLLEAIVKWEQELETMLAAPHAQVQAQETPSVTDAATADSSLMASDSSPPSATTAAHGSSGQDDAAMLIDLPALTTASTDGSLPQVA